MKTITTKKLDSLQEIARFDRWLTLRVYRREDGSVVAVLDGWMVIAEGEEERVLNALSTLTAETV